MMGSGAAERSKEAVGMIALHVALRSVCLNSDWNYAVFWTIRPRPVRIRAFTAGESEVAMAANSQMTMVACEYNANMLLVLDFLFNSDKLELEGKSRRINVNVGRWVLQRQSWGVFGGDGSCQESFQQNVHSVVQLWRRVWGRLIGKVASDKCHKWVFKEPKECEQNASSYWQSSVDATIAVIQAGHGLLQLGSCKMIPEDLHFVLRMRHIFESLCYQSGFHLPHLFSSTRDISPSSAVPVNKPAMPLHPLPPLFNWGPTPIPSASSMPNVHTPAGFGVLPPSKDKARMFLLPHASRSWMEGASGDDENDIKWPNGLTFVNALTGRSNEAKLLFQPNSDYSSLHDNGVANASNGFLSVDCNARMEEKFLSSFTLPVRMTTSSSLISLDHVADQDPVEYGIGAGMFSDDMRSFLG
ncbi:protein RICE SALT SENSITIVE 3 [Sesamum angolense]|uniref:Protein RICE SALT SENSITIVE 3 n=1 Tax=Sesamum angolense TaxID=2727404 RepID=A0AAE1WRS4_9LAMI|nr:protein RICE SALT SENSITIVE 3 [Sesamum angolense]